MYSMIYLICLLQKQCMLKVFPFIVYVTVIIRNLPVLIYSLNFFKRPGTIYFNVILCYDSIISDNVDFFSFYFILKANFKLNIKNKCNFKLFYILFC